MAVTPLTGVHPTRIRLSETARLELALEGPGPLRVELPDPPERLLDEAARKRWKIDRPGPVKVEPLGDGRERWSRTYRLSPFDRGDHLPLAFAPVRVTAGTDLNPQEITWPAVDGGIGVFTTVPEANAADARLVTGIEELPPVVEPPPAEIGWYVVAGLAGVFGVAVVLALVRQWRTPLPPLPPGEWAGRELDRIERSGANDAEAALRVAAVLREYVERRYGLPAPRQTTAELLAACQQADWPADTLAGLKTLLDRCDRAKFAGDAYGGADVRELVAHAREWLLRHSPLTAAGGL